MTDEILNLGVDANVAPSFVSKATDPVLPGAATPSDFSAVYPTPVDVTELLAMCDEVSLWKALPEERTMLHTYIWRETNELAFAPTKTVSFANGECPEDFAHDGDNRTVSLKWLGARKTLTDSDIMHSMGSIASGYGMRQLVGGTESMPGGNASANIGVQAFADLKAREMALAGVLTLNGWDRLLVKGSVTTNPLEFDGIETLITAANGAHSGASVADFSASEFDRFLSGGCGKPTHILGHPAAIQELLSGYFQLGSQNITFSGGSAVIPGFNFASVVNTGVGQLVCIADTNFTRTDATGGKFTTKLYPVRMSHNGEQLIYKVTQIPLSFKDLAPGCTSIAFQIAAKTALVVKAMCAQGVYSTTMTGAIATSCPIIG